MKEYFKPSDCEDTATSVNAGIQGYINIKDRAAIRHMAVVENEQAEFDIRVLSAMALFALSRDSWHVEGSFGVYAKIDRFFQKYMFSESSSSWQILRLVSPRLS